VIAFDGVLSVTTEANSREFERRRALAGCCKEEAYVLLNTCPSMSVRTHVARKVTATALHQTRLLLDPMLLVLERRFNTSRTLLTSHRPGPASLIEERLKLV
jgi:hypothetical protein